MALSIPQLMRLMGEKRKFEERHPRLVSFFENEFSKPIEEGTILEISITRPGEKPVSANLKLTKEDEEVLKNFLG